MLITHTGHFLECDEHLKTQNQAQEVFEFCLFKDAECFKFFSRNNLLQIPGDVIFYG